MAIEFIATTCPSCGGELRVPNNRDFVKCMCCGKDIILHNLNADPQRANIDNWMKLADIAKDSNPQEAIQYYTRVLEYESENYLAWFGCAKATCKLSTLENPRYYEILILIKAAIEYCPENKKKELKESATRELFVFVAKYMVSICMENANFLTYLDRYKKIIFPTIDYILLITSPNNPNYVLTAGMGKDSCKDLIKRIPLQGDYRFFEQDIGNIYQKYLNRIVEVNPSH